MLILNINQYLLTTEVLLCISFHSGYMTLNTVILLETACDVDIAES